MGGKYLVLLKKAPPAIMVSALFGPCNVGRQRVVSQFEF